MKKNSSIKKTQTNLSLCDWLTKRHSLSLRWGRKETNFCWHSSISALQCFNLSLCCKHCLAAKKDKAKRRKINPPTVTSTAAVDLQIFKPTRRTCIASAAGQKLQVWSVNRYTVSIGSARFDSQLSNWLCASLLGRDVGSLRLLNLQDAPEAPRPSSPLSHLHLCLLFSLRRLTRYVDDSLWTPPQPKGGALTLILPF